MQESRFREGVIWWKKVWHSRRIALSIAKTRAIWIERVQISAEKESEALPERGWRARSGIMMDWHGVLDVPVLAADIVLRAVYMVMNLSFTCFSDHYVYTRSLLYELVELVSIRRRYRPPA